MDHLLSKDDSKHPPASDAGRETCSAELWLRRCGGLQRYQTPAARKSGGGFSSRGPRETASGLRYSLHLRFLAQQIQESRSPAAHFAFQLRGAITTGTSPRLAAVEVAATGARVGVLNLDNADGIVTSAVIDPAGGFAYFGAGSAGTGGRVVKVRLSDFSRVSALTLNATEDFLFTAVYPTGERQVLLRRDAPAAAKT